MLIIFICVTFAFVLFNFKKNKSHASHNNGSQTIKEPIIDKNKITEQALKDTAEVAKKLNFSSQETEILINNVKNKNNVSN